MWRFKILFSIWSSISVSSFFLLQWLFDYSRWYCFGLNYYNDCFSVLRRMGIQRNSKMPNGAQNFTFWFRAATKQFDWLEVSMVHDKSEEHNIIYDSYNTEITNNATSIVKRLTCGCLQCRKWVKVWRYWSNWKLFRVHVIYYLELQRSLDRSDYKLCK